MSQVFRSALLCFAICACSAGAALAQEPPAAPTPPPAPPAGPPSKEEGAKIWNDKKSKCATCHGADGKADTKMGKSKGVTDMTTAEWQKKHSDAQIIEAIMKGLEREENGKKVKMEPMKGATQRDADALLLFVRSLAPPAAASK